jgi:transposase-like protein/DNA-directed RNA polymerase subunit RPC12/RpoP
MFAHTTPQQSARILRGQSMVEKGFEPTQINDNTFQVQSQSGNGMYTVLHKYNAWTCDCPDYTYRHIECKHIHAIRFWQTLKQQLVAEQWAEAEKIEAEIEANRGYEHLICFYCGSERIMKHGTRMTKTGNKTRMWCKRCHKTFTLENEAGFERMQVTSKMVTVALDLYFKGTSLRKIVDHLDQFYERPVHNTTVLFWVKKYSAIISRYAETLQPQLGDIWHTDEMKIKTKREDWSWLWNVMDSQTRFLVANLVTKKREVEDAQGVFAKAHKLGKPELLITDGMQSYHKAFNKEFYDIHKTSEHVRADGLTARSNNNKVERLHNTVRERVKVMRGLHNDKTATAFNDGFKAYYNFIRPHQALNGKTPAEVAGVDLKLGKNKWDGLIKKSAENMKG